MGEAIDDIRYAAALRRREQTAQGNERIMLFRRIARRLGVKLHLCDDRGVHIKIHRDSNVTINIWPTTDKYRYADGRVTQHGMLRVFFNLKFSDAQVGKAALPVDLRPTLYHDAYEIVLETGKGCQEAIQMCALTQREAADHILAWKYFFGPYVNPVVCFQDSAPHHIEFDEHIRSTEHGLWNTSEDTAEARALALYHMSELVKDRNSYEDIF